MTNPYVYILQRENWQFFGTLTFKNSTVGSARRMVPWFTYIREVARHKRVHFRELRWVVRLEHGEREGRPHYHYLLSGLPSREVNDSVAGFLGGLWSSSLKFGYGPVRTWDGRDAVSYVLKDMHWNAGANQYESKKFGSADRVEFGQSFISYALESLVPKPLAKLPPTLPPQHQDTPITGGVVRMECSS